MTKTSTAALVRAALKTRLGYNSKQVSVRADHNSIEATVRVPGIRTKQVAAVVGEFGKIRRDEATQEVLSGANVYTFTYLDERVVTARPEQFSDWLAAIEPGNTCHAVPHPALAHMSVNRRERNPHLYFIYDAEDVHREMNAAEVNWYLRAELAELGAP